MRVSSSLPPSLLVRGRLATSVPISFVARELRKHVAILEREIAELEDQALANRHASCIAELLGGDFVRRKDPPHMSKKRDPIKRFADLVYDDDYQPRSRPAKHGDPRFPV